MPHAITRSIEKMDGMMRPDFGQPPPGWKSSSNSNRNKTGNGNVNGNHPNSNSNRFMPTNGQLQFQSSGNGSMTGAWINKSQHNRPKFHGNNMPQSYSYAHAARTGGGGNVNVPPPQPPQSQFHIRNSQQHLYRNASVDPRFPLSQLGIPLMTGDCVNERKQTSFNVDQNFGNVSTFIRPANNNANNWCWPSQPPPPGYGYNNNRGNNNNSQSDAPPMTMLTRSTTSATKHSYDANNSRRAVKSINHHQSSSVTPLNNNMGHHQCYENEGSDQSKKIFDNHQMNLPKDKSRTGSKTKYTITTDNADIDISRSIDNIDEHKCCFTDESDSTTSKTNGNSNSVGNSTNEQQKTDNRSGATLSTLTDAGKIERLVIYDDTSDCEEQQPETDLDLDIVQIRRSQEPEHDRKNGNNASDTRKIVLDLEPIDQTLTFGEQNVESEVGDNLEIDNDNQFENESDDGDKENESEEQQSQSDIDNNGEKRKFTKSYWRKQRRLRLKERLMAQKALIENDPDHVPEERDHCKVSKAIKSKEIDYDSYLPAHVLMHVKRDLVSVLMEYGQTREVKVAFEDMERSGPHHASRFHTAAIVDEEKFLPGSGSSKKNAKKAAAAHALKTMYERGRKNLETVNERAHKHLCGMTTDEVGSHAHRVVLVSRHVLETVEETQFINYSKDKIAATFVLEYHGKMRVVGLGTGNRCILYQHMTMDGKRVIHSHAEVMAKRAFHRYLYKQLLNYQANRTHPIFARSETGKLKIRDKIQVHLYISRPPCGDAAAFPTISNFPNKMRAIRKQGQLRTIIDDGEGAIPTDFAVPAGANGKERLRIMTCSDKICRWNVLGVQGALLSHYLDPIYINSLVIGSHTGDQRGHVPRAVSGRLKCGRLHEVIQRPYRINSPEIHYPLDELADQYNITKSKQYCITWSYGDSDAEILDAITGLTNMEDLEEVVSSRVSKTILFDLFHQVCTKFGRGELLPLDYMKAKKSAVTFNRMKSFVGQHLSAMGFGQWYSLQETYGTDNFPCPEEC